MSEEEKKEMKPAIKFILENNTKQQIADSDIDILLDNGKMMTVQDVGNGYVLVSETRIMEREKFFGGEE